MEAGEIQQTEGWFEARPGLSLYERGWAGAQAASPLVIVHGGGEHSGRYAETAACLAQAGYAVCAFDLPGHGRSPGVRGHIERFEEYLECVGAFVGLVAGRHAPRRPVLLGHSLGGLIATAFAAARREPLSCLVLSSPLWGLSVPVPWWKRAAGRLLSPVWPSLTLARPHQKGLVLSHDLQVEAAYHNDPLVHYRASVRLYTEILETFAQLPRLLPEIRVPTLVLEAGEDRLASTDTVRRLFPLIGSQDKRLIVYEGYYHEVLNEVERPRVRQDLLDWLRARGGRVS